MKIIEIPGSKSLTNRALIMASLADGKSAIRNHSKSSDSRVLINALKKLGISISEKPDNLTIIGNGGKFKPFSGVIDTGDAGTTMRFLTSLITLVPGKISLMGSKRLMERPIMELKQALKEIKTGEVSIKGNISSQFISSLLMIAPILKKGLKIQVIGKLVSSSYVEMTVDLLNRFGIEVINNQNREFIVDHQEFKPVEYQVESDASGASYFWGIAAVTGKKIRVENINQLSKQGDVNFPGVLKKMGCLVKKDIKNHWIEVKGPKTLQGVTVDMGLMPDTAQTLAVIAAFAKGITKITGLLTLKVKETDRLLALKNELAKIGIKSQIDLHSIIVFGGKPKPAEIETHNDHRMAMAFAVAKAKIPELIVKNPKVVEKSFPDFWEKFNQL